MARPLWGGVPPSEDFQPPDPHNTLVVVSVSGGKDSTATSLYLREQGIEHVRVFADTGWEHPDTLEYIDNYLPSVIGPIHVVAREGGLPALARKKGMFPSRVRRYCTVELKVKPIMAFLEELDPKRRAINAVGIRAEESTARAKMHEWEHDANGFERWVWRPLITWKLQDVIDIHRRNGVMPNPLYLTRSERVGCWPCIFARKSEIKTVAEETPWRIDEIRELEADLQERARARYVARGEGETFTSEDYPGGPTFFYPANKRQRGEYWPIDRAVEWSKTGRRGKGGEMFYDEAEPGCVRWGLCDSGPKQDGAE